MEDLKKSGGIVQIDFSLRGLVEMLKLMWQNSLVVRYDSQKYQNINTCVLASDMAL